MSTSFSNDKDVLSITADVVSHLSARELINALEHIDGVTRRVHSIRQQNTPERDYGIKRVWGLFGPLRLLCEEVARRKLVLPEHLRRYAKYTKAA